MISNKLRELRTEKNLTQQELAKILNVSNKTVSHWESGYTEPPINVIVLLKKFFHISYEELLEDD